MSVGHLDVLFAEMSVHLFCPFLDWIICSLGVEFEKFFTDFGLPTPFVEDTVFFPLDILSCLFGMECSEYICDVHLVQCVI